MLVSNYNLCKLISQTLASKCASIAAPHIINLCSPISRAYQLPTYWNHTHPLKVADPAGENQQSFINSKHTVCALVGLHLMRA